MCLEGNFNPECAEERLCPAQPASECAGTLRPARPVGADLQKIGCASPLLRFVGHDLAYERRHRVGVDDVLNRGAPVVRISGFKCAPRVEMRLPPPVLLSFALYSVWAPDVAVPRQPHLSPT
jgi:hypothetical protein